jgi:predicted ATPase
VDRQSLQPIRRALRRYFAQTPGPTTDADRAAFDARFADLLQATTDEQVKADLVEAHSFAAALVDILLPGSSYMRMQPEQRRQHMQMAIRALVRAESLSQPLVIHVEDGHWLDSESREVLGLLLRTAERYPYAIVITARPARFDPPAVMDAPLHNLKLEPLDVHGVTELAAARLRAAPGPALIDLLMDRARGNPFHAVQILTYLQESGLIAGGELRTGAGGADTPLPLDVHNVLVARLGRLDGGARSVLAQASVLGREFPLAELRSVVGDEAAVATALGAADAQEILEPLPGDRYQFNHALLHAAAYDSQFAAQRQDHHRRAARAIARQMAADQPEYARIAHHWDEAGETHRAATNYLQAGDYARKNYFIREAHAHYSRGLALSQDDGERLKLHLGREQVNHWLGNRAEQQADLDQLTALTAESEDSAQWAEIALRRATFSLTVGEYTKAIQQAQEAARLAAGRNDYRLEAQAYHRWGRALWQQGNPQAAAPILRRALRLASMAADSFEQAQCLYDLSSLAFFADNYALAEEQIGQALPLFEELRDKRNVVRCVNLLGLIANAQARYEAAMGHYERSLALCRSIDWPYGEAHALGYLGNCLFELGEFEECRKMHREAIALARHLADREFEAYSLDTIGLAHQYEGDLPAARRYFEEALALHKAIGNSRSAYTLTHLGLCLTDLEELEQAGVLLYEAISQRSDSAADRVSIDTKAALAWLDMARGDVDLAAEQIRDVIDWLAANGVAGVELPLQVYWQSYAILRMTGAVEEAMSVLQAAHSLLQSRAAGIADPNRRHRYLTGVVPHRQILAAWESTAA